MTRPLLRLARWPVAAAVALWVALHAPPALAADRDPLDFPLRQYVLLLSVALLGGLVSWYAKVRSGTVAAYSVTILIGELATSAFAGLLAFWLCAWSGVPQLVTIALVGVSGHMGARAIAAFEAWAQQRLLVQFPTPTPPPPPPAA